MPGVHLVAAQTSSIVKGVPGACADRKLRTTAACHTDQTSSVRATEVNPVKMFISDVYRTGGGNHIDQLRLRVCQAGQTDLRIGGGVPEANPARPRSGLRHPCFWARWGVR